MSLQKSFLDMNSLEMPWVGSQISLLPSTGNSQNETLFDSQSQMLSTMDLPMLPPQLALHSEDNRRLHQDHKIIKRAVDKNSQEAAASLSSLHEKISKVNLSINDLHSDLKKLERTVTMDNHSPHSSVVNMELKLGSIVQSLESRLASNIGKILTDAIDKKINGVLARVEELAARPISAPNEYSNSEKMMCSLEALIRITSQVQRNIEQILRKDGCQTALQPYYSSRPTPTVSLLDLQNKAQRIVHAEPSNALVDAHSNNLLVNTQRIAFDFKINKRRTSCDKEFLISDAMQRASIEWAIKQTEAPKKRPRTSKHR